MQIIYKEKAYNGVVQFNGSLLKLTVYADDGNQDAFTFSVDSLTCTVSFKELEKVYQTEKVHESFLPVAIYKFFSQVGSVVQTEIYGEQSQTYFIERTNGTVNVSLNVKISENT